jgi:uncharacterized membrane protein YphA (DoxX/SURF4 family)
MKSEHFRPLTFLLSHDIPIAGFMMAIGLSDAHRDPGEHPGALRRGVLRLIEQGLFTQNQGLAFTALILFLLCMLLIRGPGRWSVDAYLEQAQPE